jgi:hypothetical protein
LAKGTTAIFNGSLLKATDAEQQPGQLVYTVNSLPENGKLLLNGTALGQNASFTQADIDLGRLSYINLGGIKQLTTNSTGDYDPRVSGSNVVWAGTGGSDGGTDYEIFLFNGTATTQLTTNSTGDYDPRVSGSNVVWTGPGGSDGGSDYEIFLFNGTSTTQLTTNSTDDFGPRVSGSNVLWAGRGGSDGGSDFEIFFFGNPANRDRFNFTVSDGAGGSTAGTFNFTIG